MFPPSQEELNTVNWLAVICDEVQTIKVWGCSCCVYLASWLTVPTVCVLLQGTSAQVTAAMNSLQAKRRYLGDVFLFACLSVILDHLLLGLVSLGRPYRTIYLSCGAYSTGNLSPSLLIQLASLVLRLRPPSRCLQCEKLTQISSLFLFCTASNWKLSRTLGTRINFSPKSMFKSEVVQLGIHS